MEAFQSLAALASQMPSSFILPDELRPQLSEITTLDSIPVIDLQNHGDAELVEQISNACGEYGFFQVINHGVPQDVCLNMLDAVKELMVESPPELKAVLYSEDTKKDGRLFRHHLKDGGKKQVQLWSEIFHHSWHPSKDFSSVLPPSPLKYREVMSVYAKEIGQLYTRLFKLLSLGLGLDKDYLERRHGNNPRRRTQSIFYPPCPNPESTLGLEAHTDLGTLTILQQSEGVSGLQVIKDGKWVSVEPIPNSFIINVGDQLHVLSNGKYQSVHHRVVTNKDKFRIAVAMFYGPDEDTMVGPIQELIDQDQGRPPRYRNYLFEEFVKEVHRQEGMKRRVKEVFELPDSS